MVKTIFAEDLGYFSGFKMVYEFENVAYSTKIGDVSQPFRTQFGYHIVQVYEKRKSKGERTVAHIMISSNEKDSLQENPQTRINDIYKKINQGEDFESLAKQFSEDNSSAKKGGKLAPFSGGQLTSIEFEEVAFGLQKEGDISQPFKTAFGWHIVKLYGKKPIESFEIMKPELEARVKKDKRSQLINTSHVNSLIEKYNINTSIQPALDYFETVLNSDYFSGKWTLPENFDGNKPLIKIENSQLMYSDFANFIVTSQRRSSPKKTLKELTKVLYDSFLGSQLVQYQEDNLESENEDFANIMGEYRDGLLLFDLMDSEIWSAAKTDSVAIQEFYDEHKQDYYWNERIDAVVASSAKQSILKKTAKLLDKGKTQDQIKQELNTKNKINVIFSSGLMSANHQALPRNFKFKKGLSGIHKLNDAFVIVKVNEIQPKTIKSLEESKGKVISDYQEQKEVNWIKKLKEKYPVVVNEDVLNKVRNQINN